MCKSGNLQTALSIDLKKNRIRIHKESLRLIGDPEYIQLLVNVEKSQVAIRGMEQNRKGSDAHKVNRAQIASDFSYEIYSRSFIVKLCSAFPQFDNACTYRLTGIAFPNDKAAIFDVLSMNKVES